MKYLLSGVSAILLVLIVGGIAFYFGTKSTKPADTTPPTVIQVNNGQEATPTVTSTQVQTKAVAAGGVLSFSPYTLNIPLDWNSQREQGDNNDKLTLTKGAYTIAIYEAAFGGGGCLYPGDAPSEMAQTFASFVEINNSNGFVFRRSPVDANGKSAWTVCQKNTSDGSFGSPTQFGAISITGPLNPSDTVLAEIDAILTSIKK